MPSQRKTKVRKNSLPATMSSDFKQASPEGLQHFIYVSYLPWIKVTMYMYLPPKTMSERPTGKLIPFNRIAMSKREAPWMCSLRHVPGASLDLLPPDLDNTTSISCLKYWRVRNYSRLVVTCSTVRQFVVLMLYSCISILARFRFVFQNNSPKSHTS